MRYRKTSWMNGQPTMQGIRIHPRFVGGHFTNSVRDVPLKLGLPPVEDLHEELCEYVDILLGRVEPPINHGVATLMEVANAYFSRACEIDMLIHEGERSGSIIRNSSYYKFRTGELRSFLDLAKRCFDMGSRLITVEQLRLSERLDSGI